MVTLSVLVLIFVVGHQLSNANPPDGTDYSIGSVIRKVACGVLRTGYAQDGTEVALKVMRKEDENIFRLQSESHTLGSLYKSQKAPLYLPKPLGYREITTTRNTNFGTQNNVFKVMVMELLGRNFENLQKECRNDAAFGKYTAIHLGIKLIEAVKGIHAGGYVLRALDPSSIVIRREDITEIAISDFGFAKKANPPTIFFTGFLNFMSLNAHNGRDVGKVQDLESLFYILIKFSVGSLPWANYKLSITTVSLFKRTLLKKFADNSDKFLFTRREQYMIKKYNGFASNSEMEAFKTQLQNEHPGLYAYAQVLVQIMIREKNNPLQNITKEDYAALLAGFQAEMGNLPDVEKKLDWVTIENEANNSRNLHYKRSPSFSMEVGEDLLDDGEDGEESF